MKPCPKHEYKPEGPWEEDPKEVELCELIGKGNFGEVYRGIWMKKWEVAVKTLDLDGEDAKEALDECEVLKKVRHEKIIKLW